MSMLRALSMYLPGTRRAPTAEGAATFSGHSNALDGIRGVAAFVVLFGHSCYLLSDNIHTASLWGSVIKSVSHIGHLSVVLFFVLSGFVLYIAFDRRPDTPYQNYLIRRVLRIYPAMLVAIAGAAVIHLLQGSAHVPSLGLWTNATWVVPINWLTIVRNVLLLGISRSDSAIDPVVWSLAIEMRFSFIFPLAAILCRRSRLALLLVSLGGYVFARHILASYHMELPYIFGRTPAGTLAVTLFYFPCFCFGIAAADYLLDRDRRSWVVPSVLPGIAVALLLVLARLSGDDLGWGLAFSGLILLACRPGLVSALAQLPVCLYLGRISYSLYLVHLPVLLAVVFAFHGLVPLNILVIAGPIVSVLLAELMHRTVELPGIALGKHLVSVMSLRTARLRAV